MIKKHLKLLIITSLIILVPVVVGLLLWEQLPAQVPTHWNAAGEVDGWGSKAFAVLMLPLIMLGVHWLCVVATAADPKKQNHADKILQLILWVIPVLTNVIQLCMFAAAMGKSVPIEVIVPVLTGFALVIVGNYLPKCKQNYTIGIKIPWTLNSEENWNRTHRLAGWVWTAGGLVIIISGFFGFFWMSLIAAAPMVFVPVTYSYILHRKGI